MSIVVTGARGMVGTAFLNASPSATGFGRELDVTDPAGVREKFEELEPEWVLHLAAATDVDRCEREPDWARAVNTEAAGHVAKAASVVGARLIHVSTTAVFGGDGAPGPFSEDDEPQPPNVYARTKLEGELAVREACPNALVVRTAWVMGGGTADKKFVGKVRARLLAGDPIKAVDDQFGSPTYAADLADALVSFIRNQAFEVGGLVHVTNQGRASRYDMAKLMKTVLGSASAIEPVPASTFPLPARRSVSDVSISRVLPQMGLFDLMPTWQDALTRYLNSW